MAKKEDKKTNDKGTTKPSKATTKGKKVKDEDLTTPKTSGKVKGPKSSSDRSIKNPASTGENNEDPSISGKVKGPKSLSDRSIKNPASKPKKIKDEDLKMPSATGDKKGPMAKGKATTTAKPKYPTEVGKAAKEGSEGTESTEAKKLPKPKKALPKKTTASQDKTQKPKAAGKTSTGKKPSKSTKMVEDEEISADEVLTGKAGMAEAAGAADAKKTRSDAKTTKTTGTKRTTTKTVKKSKTSTDAPKSSARKKKEGAKTSTSDSSLTEDLKKIAVGAAKGVADRVLPDEETRKDIADTAKDLIPDKEDILKTANDIKDKLSPEIDQVNKVADKVIPQDEIRDKAEKIKSTAKNISNRNEEKAAEKKYDEISLFSEFDIHLFKEGKHFHLYKKFGSHLMEFNGQSGVYFALWAPNAEQVSVIGDFNEWYRQAHPMRARQDGSGIWEAFIPEAKKGSIYKYFIRSTNGYEVEKGDPYAFFWEVPPNTASVVWDLESTWNDDKWMKSRKEKAGTAQPMSVYELHVGSWKRVPEDNMRSLTYRELAQELPRYLKELGFTHVEFMPVMEHPFFGSWGYQVTGYFAPSSRFGNPQDFMFLIEALHEEGIGVILDWVPSHFPSDMHGLHYFDGTFLYEHADPRKGFHPDWQSYIFNYGRNEVRSFLISNALFWLDKFHADGLRVDAVASMLYLDYSRKEGEWEPNEHGGNENLEAISFIKEFNEVVYSQFPDAVTIAEESTAWPMVSKPTYMGGLGFGMKWMMGWMHDTLEYFQKDPIHRKHHQNTITFSTTYAFTENFMLPLSHDEVVYGKQAIINKMPGDPWNKFANLRALYAYMFAHPGTKLLFMGGEFGQTKEWNHDSSLDWHLTEDSYHRQVQETIAALNRLYTTESALYEKAFDAEGFEWIDINDAESSVISFVRKGKRADDNVIVVCNLTPVARENYRIGVPEEGTYKEIFNSDDAGLGGSNVKNENNVQSEAVPTHQKNHSLSLTLPPMAVIYLKKEDTQF